MQQKSRLYRLILQTFYTKAAKVFRRFGLVNDAGQQNHALQQHIALLQEKAESLSVTLESMGDGVIATDASERITMLNRAAEELTGWRRDAAVGAPFTEVFRTYNSMTGEPGSNIVETVLSTNRNVQLANHTVLVSADGVHRHINDSAAPIHDASGKLTGAVLVFSDITERYNLQQQLRESEARSRSAIQLARLGTWEWDVKSNEVAWSDLYYEIHGVDQSIKPNSDIWKELVLPEDFARAEKIKNEALRSQTQYQQSFRILRRSDGAIRHVQTFAEIDRDEQGAPRKVLGVQQDITEHVEAQEKIRESEALFRSTFEQAAVGIMHTSLEGRFLRINQKACVILGFTCEELLDQPYLALTHPDDIQISQENVHRMLNGLAVEFEKRYIRKDGQIIWVSMTGYLKRGFDGEPQFFIVTIQDITEKMAVAQALQNSERRLEKAQAISQSGNWELDLQTGLMWASKEAFRIYGFLSQGEYIDLSAPQQRVLADERPMLDARLKLLLSQNEPYDVEFRINRENDGALRILHSVAQVERDGLGKPLKVLGVVQDITEKKLTEEEYKTAIQTTREGFWIVDRAGNFLEVNEALCSMLGYQRQEMLSMNIARIEAIESPDDVLEHIQRIRAAGAHRFESKLQQKNGTVIDVEVSAHHIQAGNRTCAFIRDITERKKRENEIIHLSYHDVLTGLYNRTFFEEEYRRLDTARQLPLSMLMGDINGLKLTNDVFGHAEGDSLLRTIAGILRECARKEDILARIGGDEFCILLPQAGDDIAKMVCDRIYAACDAYELILDDGVYHPSISLGFATRISMDQPMTAVLKAAEDSMYKRKLLERKSMHSSLISSIKMTMFEKSHETREHADRLSALAHLVGVALELPYDQLSELELLSMLHDLGKIGIDDHILSKPGELTEEEWDEMKKHPEIGYRIALASPELITVAESILCHHERWDGTGYPQGLTGESIPLLSRILAVVDSYDAMTHDRVYHMAVDSSEAIKEIADNAGRQFDPAVVDGFLRIMKQS